VRRDFRSFRARYAAPATSELLVVSGVASSDTTKSSPAPARAAQNKKVAVAVAVATATAVATAMAVPVATATTTATATFFPALHVRAQASFYLCRSKQPPTQIKAHWSQVLRTARTPRA